MNQQGISDAIANPYKSGVAIAKTLQVNNGVPQLPATTSLAHTLNSYLDRKLNPNILPH